MASNTFHFNNCLKKMTTKTAFLTKAKLYVNVVNLCSNEANNLKNQLKSGFKEKNYIIN